MFTKGLQTISLQNLKLRSVNRLNKLRTVTSLNLMKTKQDYLPCFNSRHLHSGTNTRLTMEGRPYVLLDGGTATELTRLGHTDIEEHALWSSVLLQRNPEAIRKMHESFLAAGSDIILTVSYQATVGGMFIHAGITEQDAINLIQLSVRLARQACDNCATENKKAKVAGSMGSLGVQYADGSEYSGEYVDSMNEKEIQDMHRPQIKAHLGAGVDFLAFETFPAMKEATAVVNLLETEFPQAKAWLTFCCKNGLQTCHGDSFQSAIKSVYQSKNIVAVGVNCTDPTYVTSLLKSIQCLDIRKPIIVKPNSGEVWDSSVSGWTGAEKCQSIHGMLEEWVENGATWIGGCCRVYPENLAQMRERLDELVKKNSGAVK